MRSPSRVILATVLMSVIFAGCETTAPKEKEPTSKTVSVSLPTLTPLPETKISQERGGLLVELGPVPFEIVKKRVTTKKRDSASFNDIMNANCPKNSKAVVYALTTTDSWELNRPNLEFLLKITNKMPRSFRGEGAVVRYQVGGADQVVPKEQYAELTNALILTRETGQLRFQGPAVRDWTPNSRIRVLLAEVVTKTDAAGNAVNRENFEWIFTYEAKALERPVEISYSRSKPSCE